MKDEQEVFVSRHGRRVKLDDVDLSGVDIEKPEQPVEKPTKISSPKVRIQRPSIRLPRPQMSKKKSVVFASVILLVLLLPLVLLEILALQYRTAGESLKTDVTRIGATVALPAQKSSNPDAIDISLTALSKSRNDVCKGGLLDNLANVYPRSRDALKQCNEISSEVSRITDTLSVLKSMHAYGKSVDAAMKPALAASDSPYAVIPDQVSSWQSLTGSLQKINAPNELKSFHASLIQLTTDIASQWTALNNANNSSDAAAFKEAETKLGSFYESMRELAPTLVTVQSDVQADLKTAISNVR